MASKVVTQRGIIVPQWLYDAVQIPLEKEGECPPSSFENTTWSRMRLINLSFTGEYVLATERSAIPTIPMYHPPWARELLVDIGTSGYSDQNLVRASLATLCASPQHFREKQGANCMGRHLDLVTPYALPRDEGLAVAVETRWSGFLYEVGEQGEERVRGLFPEATFIAKGYDDKGFPVMLAGSSGDLVRSGQQQAFDSADLFNNGNGTAYLTSFHFKCLDTIYVTDELDFGWKGSATHFGWRVNPTNMGFTPFMPNPLFIPTGNLTPMDRNYDGGAESPLVYWFPKNTYLDPRQELSVHFANIREFVTELEVPDKINLCLHVELEVE